MDVTALPRRYRTGRYWDSLKENGGYRVKVSLGRAMRVGHRLAKKVVHASFVPSPHIGDWHGRGVNYHWNRVLQRLRPGTYVVVADVCDCFQSFNPDYLYQIPLLPSGLVESCLDYRRVRLREVLSNAIPHVRERTVPLGLITGGSASNVLWSIAIDDLPMAVPAGVWANTYADNIIIVSSTQAEAEEAEKRLIQYFDRHPAGPFRLRIIARGKVDELSFDHLGYSVHVEGGSLALWPTVQNLIKMSKRVHGRAAAQLKHSYEEALDCQMQFFATELDQFSQSFPFMCANARTTVADEIETQWHLARSSHIRRARNSAFPHN